VLGYGVRYCWLSFPIISGFGAKVLCSSVFVSGREEQRVRQEELAHFPLSLGHFTVDYKDSSVTGSVWGFEKKIYRRGLGSTLVSELSEEAIRAEKMALAVPPSVGGDTVPWPVGDKVADSLPAGLDKAVLLRAIDSAFAETDTVHPFRTRAVIVVRASFRSIRSP